MAGDLQRLLREYAPHMTIINVVAFNEIIEGALLDLGVDRTAIVRTRMFVTDISRWEEFGDAHREFFGEHRPATTMVEVKSLIDPAMLIEIEADAVAG